MNFLDEKLLNKTISLLKEKKLTVATAESCTGGLIAHTFTNISGIFSEGQSPHTFFQSLYNLFDF